MEQAVVVDCLRTAVGKVGPRHLAEYASRTIWRRAVIRRLAGEVSGGTEDDVDDVILGCAMPEANRE